MARKTVIITITNEGRDKGKVFVINEMSASALEDWAARVFLGMTKSGAKIADDVAAAGVAGMASMGIGALMGGMSIDILRPLLTDMMDCIFIIPDPKRPEVKRPIVDDGNGDDIEELSTRLKLRADWYALHTGFSMPGVRSNSTQTTGKKGHENSRNT